MEQEFKAGDFVKKLTSKHEDLSIAFGVKGGIYMVDKVNPKRFNGKFGSWLKHTKDHPYNSGWLDADDFEKVELTAAAINLINHQAYIDAMEATVRKYAVCISEGREYCSSFPACALCEVSEVMSRTDSGEAKKCARCPWVVMTGDTCLNDAAFKKSKDHPTRIIELREWKKIYQEDLDRITQEAEAKSKKVWEPLKIELTLNTPEEAAAWWAALNTSLSGIRAIIKKGFSHSARGEKLKTVAVEDLDFGEPWSQIDKALKAHFKD